VVDLWRPLDDALIGFKDLKALQLKFIVRYSGGRDLWDRDDVKAVERTSFELESCLSQLFPALKRCAGGPLGGWHLETWIMSQRISSTRR